MYRLLQSGRFRFGFQNNGRDYANRKGGNSTPKDRGGDGPRGNDAAVRVSRGQPPVVVRMDKGPGFVSVGATPSRARPTIREPPVAERQRARIASSSIPQAGRMYAWDAPLGASPTGEISRRRKTRAVREPWGGPEKEPPLRVNHRPASFVQKTGAGDISPPPRPVETSAVRANRNRPCIRRPPRTSRRSPGRRRIRRCRFRPSRSRSRRAWKRPP